MSRIIAASASSIRLEAVRKGRFYPVACSSQQPDGCPLPDGRHHSSWADGSLPLLNARLLSLLLL